MEWSEPVTTIYDSDLILLVYKTRFVVVFFLCRDDRSLKVTLD